MIFEGLCEVRNRRCVRERYSKKVKKPPQAMVYTIDSKPPIGYVPQPDDIFFTQADASWVVNLHEDALVITTKVATASSIDC